MFFFLCLDMAQLDKIIRKGDVQFGVDGFVYDYHWTFDLWRVSGIN